MTAGAIKRHVPPGVVVVVVVIAKDMDSNMGIPFERLGSKRCKNIAPQKVIWRATKVVRLISAQRLTTLLRE